LSDEDAAACYYYAHQEVFSRSKKNPADNTKLLGRKLVETVLLDVKYGAIWNT
jgi:hypothetical protein